MNGGHGINSLFLREVAALVLDGERNSSNRNEKSGKKNDSAYLCRGRRVHFRWPHPSIY